MSRLSVSVRSGSVVIECDPATAARLAGRREFGPVEPVQGKLRDRIAGAWYAADCPPVRTRRVMRSVHLRRASQSSERRRA